MRCLTSLFLILLLTASLYGTEYLKLGDIAFGEGKYREARDAYRQAVVQDSKSVPAHLALGHALFALGEYRYAFMELRNGLELHAAPQQIYINLIDLYPTRKDFLEKLLPLANQSASKPLDIPIQFLYGYICYYSGNKGESRKVFGALEGMSHLSETEKKWVAFYINLLREEDILANHPIFVEGVYAFKRADYLKAHNSFFRTIRDQPSLGIPPLLLAHSAFALGYYKLAYKYIEKGLFFRPHDKILNSKWSLYYKNKGEWLKFLIALEGHVNAYPNDTKAQMTLLFMYYCFKKYGSAWLLLQKLSQEQIQTETQRVLFPLIEEKIKEEKIKEKKIPNKSDDPKGPEETKVSPPEEKKGEEHKKGEAYYQRLRQLGIIYFHQKEYNSALVAFNSLIPHKKEAYYEVAYVYFAKGMYDRAGDMAREGLVRNKGQEIPHIIDYFKNTDDFFQEKRRLEKYLEGNSGEGLPILFLALLEYKLGKRPRAKNLLKNLLKVPLAPEKAALILIDRIDEWDKKEKQRQVEEKKALEAALKAAQKEAKTTDPAPKKIPAGAEWLKYSVEIDGKKYPLYQQDQKKFIFYKGERRSFEGFVEIEGKKYPIIAEKNKKIVRYKGKAYLFISPEKLLPYKETEGEGTGKGPKEKTEKKNLAVPPLEVEGLSIPSKGDFKLSPARPLWTPSK